MTTLLPSDVTRAVYVVDAHNASGLLADGLKLDPRGVKTAYTPRLHLIGSLLNVKVNKNLVHADLYRTLTCDMDRQSQVDLGIRATLLGAPLFTEAAIERFSVKLAQRLEYGKGSNPDEEPEERERRRQVIAAVVDALLKSTLTPRVYAAFALDGSGIWGWGKAPRRAPQKLVARDLLARERGVDLDEVDEQDPGLDDVQDEHAESDEAEEGTDGGPATQDGPGGAAAPTSYERDGAWGVKTRKDGGRQSYYGFELHALVRAPDRGGNPDREAKLIERLDVTPANTDVVDVSLGLLRRVQQDGVPCKELLADRHYSYKSADRWAKQLTAMSIEPVVDLHKNDQGFRDYDGAKLAAGWLHCPRTPAHMATILHPGPGATLAQKKEFVEKIEARKACALRRIARTPQPRFQCPALNGTVGCASREETEDNAIKGGLPLIVNPPTGDERPKCCTQATVTMREDGQRKLWQEDYWGSEAWVFSNNRRTYVEGVFGNIKNSSAENLTRGAFRITGLARVTLGLGIIAAAHNVRQQRNWHAKHCLGDPEHPLFAPDSETLLLHLTPEEFHDFVGYRKAKAAAEAEPLKAA